MTPELVALATEHLSEVASAVTPSATTAEALQRAGVAVRRAPLSGLRDRSTDAVVLLDEELSQAGEHAEGLLAEAWRVLADDGVVLTAVADRVHAAATAAAVSGRGYDAAELARMLGHRGFVIELMCAPGAARGVAGRAPAYDAQLDCHPGLLDAAAHVAALGRRSADEADRNAAFFASLPRKVVAAAVLCHDEHHRLLLVHDRFKRHWTIPGGVVDADEDPRAAAQRETWEEAGARVHAGDLLGVFSASAPDRLILVYEAALLDDPGPLTPVHTHEIDAVEWTALDEALERLAPSIAEQVRLCLSNPGGTWRL